MKRIYHRFEKCEEYANGMWRGTEAAERAGFIGAAASLMRDPPAFRDAMIRAVNEWPFSCEQNLTASSINKQAWIGHAGCCIATQTPEDLTREAWGTLTQDQQDVANRMADEALAYWAGKYAEA
jgi:hypothetical protein